MRDDAASSGADDGFVWQIDLLRFVFAALVVVGHAYVLVHETSPDWRLWPLDRFQTGGLWVSGFFVLSGWCIERSGRARRREDVADYVVARLTRILPVYLWFLAVAVIAEFLFAVVGGRPAMWEPHAKNLLWQLSMLQGILDPYGAYNASWSLTHEILSYLAWGGLVAVVPNGRRRAVGFAATLALLSVAAVGHALIGTRASYTALTLPLYFFFWLLGSLAAAEQRIVDPQRDRRFSWAVAVVAGAMATLNLFVPLWGDTVWMVFWALALAAGLRLLTARAAIVRPPSPALLRLARFAGLASYPIYLGHGVVLIAYGTWLGRTGVTLPPAVLLPSLIAVALAGAVLLGLPVEVRSLAWRARFLRSRARTRVLVAAAAG